MKMLSNLRFRTRLALVMFLVVGCTSAILFVTYVHQNSRIKGYVTGLSSDLLAISQLTQKTIPPTASRNQALDAYMKSMSDAGISITLASPTGEVLASSNPGQVGKKIKIKKRRSEVKQEPIRISAEFRDVDVDSGIEQRTYSVDFPIVQGDKVIGYAQVRGVGDEVGQLLRRTYLLRSFWILTAMLAGMFAVVYLAFRFTKPIDMLVHGAQQVAQGNLSVSLPVKGTDEINRLAETFNRMVERLRENRELEERLNQAERSSLLGRFAASVAHEVRNSLNFINLSIDQIRAKHANGDGALTRDLQRNLARIKDEVSRLNRLVNDFMAAGRQSPPKLAPCDMKTTTQQAIALVEKQAERQGIKIKAEFSSRMPRLQADISQIRTCFVNILTNAIEAMPNGGEIRVRARSLPEDGSHGTFELRFADTGPGVAVAEREKIFAPYFSTKATGFGLGLAITRKIVEDHGGRIYVTDGQTPGTVIVMKLPLPTESVPDPALTTASPNR
jgi:signal transduction histidine kinase